MGGREKILGKMMNFPYHCSLYYILSYVTKEDLNLLDFLLAAKVLVDSILPLVLLQTNSQLLT